MENIVHVSNGMLQDQGKQCDTGRRVSLSQIEILNPSAWESGA